MSSSSCSIKSISGPNEKSTTTKEVCINDNISLKTFESNSEVKYFDEPFICMNNKFLVDTTNGKIILFYSKFKYLRKKYGLENIRKTQIDSLAKKVKSKFILSLHEIMRQSLNLFITRLPQTFITNIKIDFNKNYLNKTIEEIYTEFKIVPPLKEIMEKNLFRRGKNLLVKYLFQTQLKDIYRIYLSSRLYKYHKERVKIKEGINASKLYDYVANNIIQYFLFNKGNKSKNKRKKKTFSIKNNRISDKSNNNKNDEKKLINNKGTENSNIICNNNENLDNNLTFLKNNFNINDKKINVNYNITNDCKNHQGIIIDINKSNKNKSEHKKVKFNVTKPKENRTYSIGELIKKRENNNNFP